MTAENKHIGSDTKPLTQKQENPMQNTKNPSTRANLLTQRTYCRPKPDGTFETWEDVVNRVIEHQRWLWIRARYGHSTLSEEQEAELQELKFLSRYPYI